MPGKHSGVLGENVLRYNTCFAYPNTDSSKIQRKSRVLYEIYHNREKFYSEN